MKLKREPEVENHYPLLREVLWKEKHILSCNNVMIPKEATFFSRSKEKEYNDENLDLIIQPNMNRKMTLKIK